MSGPLDVLYSVCDLLFGWSALFGPTAALVVVGVLSGLAVILFQKYASDQDLLGRCKADLKVLKARIKDAKAAGDLEGARRLQGLSGRVGGKYMWAALKPALWTVPIIGVVGLWAGARFAYLAPRTGESLKVVAHFEDAAEGYAHVVPGPEFAVEGPAIAAVEPASGGKEAVWTLKPLRDGERTLKVRHGGRSYALPIPSTRPPELVTVFERQSPRQDRLQAVELKLKDSLPAAWWNFWLQWGGLYLLAALVVALLLRRLLRVQ
jgi:uncharacterized membrane protein (DUF106 family)